MCSAYLRRLKIIFVPTNLTLQSTCAPPRCVEPSSDGAFLQCQNLWLRSFGSNCFTTQSRLEKGRVWRKRSVQSRRSSSGAQGSAERRLSRRGVIQSARSSALLPFPFASCLPARLTHPGVQVLFGKGKPVEYAQGLRGLSCVSSECQPLCCLEKPFFTLTEEGEEV